MEDFKASKAECFRGVINNSDHNESLRMKTFASINKFKIKEISGNDWERLRNRYQEYLKIFVDGEALVFENIKCLYTFTKQSLYDKIRKLIRGQM